MNASRVIVGVPAEEYVSSENTSTPLPAAHPDALPEDIIYDNLRHCTAFSSSVELIKTLCVPHVLRKWIIEILCKRPTDSIGKDGVQCTTNYVRRIFETILSSDLNLEVECVVGHTWTIYPFGMHNRYLSIPLSLFEEENNETNDAVVIMAALQRMVLTQQSDHISAAYSRDGGAFSLVTPLRLKNRVYYKGFQYNAMLDLYFPRFQFIAAFCYEISSQARFIDRTLKDVNVDEVLAMKSPTEIKGEEVMPNVQLLVQHMNSDSVAIRLLLHKALSDIIENFTIIKNQAAVRLKYVEKDGKENEKFIPSETSNLRRIEFFSSYLHNLLACCEGTHFSPKSFAAVWLDGQEKIIASVREKYPINFY